eukprot:jgi/Ulvmu1/4845/UM020_0131.1
MDFATSSHRKRWILTEEQLSTRRVQANKAGIEFVLKLRAEHGEPTADLRPLTPSDELELVSFYAYKLAAKGVELWPRKVIATAVAFLKRFYLDQSCIQHEVRKIAFACLYIAGKVCENYIDAEKIPEHFPGAVKTDDVLSLETVVLGGLGFDLVVYHPYSYLDAMLEEINMAAENQEEQVTQILTQKPGMLNMTYKLARSFLDSMLQSDAVLTMTPQQQALCAVCHALEKHGMPQNGVLDRYANHASADAERQQALVHELQKVWARGVLLADAGHQVCSKYSQKGASPKELDMKVRTFNPLMNTTSSLYKAIKKKKKKRKRAAGEGEKE